MDSPVTNKQLFYNPAYNKAA